MAQVVCRQPLTAETRFDPRSHHMRGWWSTKWQWDIFVQVDYFGFSLSVSFQRSSILIFIYMLPLREGRMGRAWEHSQKKLWTTDFHFFLIIWREGKGNIHPITGQEGPEREKGYSSTLSLTSALDGSGWSKHSGRFTPGKNSVPLGGCVGLRAGLDWCGNSRFSEGRLQNCTALSCVRSCFSGISRVGGRLHPTGRQSGQYQAASCFSIFTCCNLTFLDQLYITGSHVGDDVTSHKCMREF